MTDITAENLSAGSGRPHKRSLEFIPLPFMLYCEIIDATPGIHASARLEGFGGAWAQVTDCLRGCMYHFATIGRITTGCPAVGGDDFSQKHHAANPGNDDIAADGAAVAHAAALRPISLENRRGIYTYTILAAVFLPEGRGHFFQPFSQHLVIVISQRVCCDLGIRILLAVIERYLNYGAGAVEEQPRVASNLPPALHIRHTGVHPLLKPVLKPSPFPLLYRRSLGDTERARTGLVKQSGESLSGTYGVCGASSALNLRHCRQYLLSFSLWISFCVS